MSAMLFLTQTVKVLIAMFIITDSVGNLPFFMGLTEGMPSPERRKVFFSATLTGLLLLAFFALAGSLVLNLFDLTMDDLKIAGGILLLFISIEVMLRGRITFEHKEEVGIVPLGCPLLVGPGAITTLLVMLRIYDFYAVLSGVLICFLLIWLVLFFSESIFRHIGRNGALIITKISGILIAAIAVRFIRQALQAIFHL
jgi:multiple antibiotic resistance protein